MIKVLRRRGSPLPNLVLAGLLLAGFTAAAAAPATDAPAQVPVSLAGQPVVSTISPLTGPSTGATTVTITGTGFTGATAVTFNGTDAASFTVDSPTQITAVTPAGTAGPVLVRVAIGACVSSAGGSFTYTAPVVVPPIIPPIFPPIGLPPIVTSISPASGSTAGGTAVTITGSFLTGATGVSVGGSAATSVVVVSSTQVTAVTPAHAAGSVGVAVTTAFGSGTLPGGYTYTEPPLERAGTRMQKVFFQMPVACPAPPGAPAPVTATAGTSSITVHWAAATPHDSPVTGYTVTASPGPATCTTLVTDADPLGCVLGATAGVQYTVSVVAESAAGASEPAVSDPVTPAAPVVPLAPPDTPLTLTTDKGRINSAAPGQQIVVIGTGFAAHSTATITLYSAPLTLGTVVTDGNGDFSKPVTVPAGIATGVHTVVAQGVAPSGNPRAMKLTVTVAPRAAAAGLAVTGAPAGPLALAGLAMVLAGAVLLRPRRPRLG
ncbi:IPT/TIG domain-containing protein [Dactylosporangium vinaceum]|nr:IPT/TIG domain-containing protein [Dactylosporangium vinaceum]